MDHQQQAEVQDSWSAGRKIGVCGAICRQGERRTAARYRWLFEMLLVLLMDGQQRRRSNRASDRNRRQGPGPAAQVPTRFSCAPSANFESGRGRSHCSPGCFLPYWVSA